MSREIAAPAPPQRQSQSLAWLTDIALCLLIIGAALGYYVWHWQTLDAFWVAIDSCRDPLCDYTYHYHPMGRAIFAGGLPHEGFLYSPLFALLLGLQTTPNFDYDLWVWGLITLAITALLYLLPALLLFRRSRWLLLLYTALFITAFPLLHNLKWGQVSALMTLGGIGALIFGERGKAALAASLLASVAAIKFYPAIYTIYFILRRDRRFLLVFGGLLALLLGLVPLLVLGSNTTSAFYAIIADNLTVRAAADALDPNSQYGVHVLLRLFDPGAGLTSPLYMPLRWGGYAMAILNVVLLWWLFRRQSTYRIAYSFILLSTALPFLISTSWPHYFVYLPIGQVLGFALLQHVVQDSRLRWGLRLGLWLPSVVLSNILLFNLIGDPQRYAGSGALFWSNALLLLLTYVLALAAPTGAPEATI